jgi:hypothetical protein
MKKMLLKLILPTSLLLLLIVASVSTRKMPIVNAASTEPVTVTTIIENNTVFPDNFGAMYMTVGDLTNDGNPDLVITKSASARAAVFQNIGGAWNNGTLLIGPRITNAGRPMVAPIRNDGWNWLVYSEHRRGNSGEWLRAHRYIGTTLEENKDITSRIAWPGWMSPGIGDLDGDGNLEVWFTSLHGGPTLHLRRHIWNPATNSYPGFEIEDGGENTFIDNQNLLSADFLGNETQSLIWAPQSRGLDLVTYTPGSGVNDHTSSLIFSPPAVIDSFDANEFDGARGSDIAITTWDGFSGAVYLISGGTFDVTQVASNLSERLRVVRMGDLDGDGLSEIYAAGYEGGIYGYDNINGWRLLTRHPGILWRDGAAARWTGADRDEVLFGAPVGGRTFRVVSLTAEPANKPPSANPNGPYSGFEGSPVTFDGIGSFDPDNDPLTYIWDFGDGSPSVNGPSPTHTYSDNFSSYNVCLTVTDSQEEYDTECTTADIANVPPDVTVTGQSTVDEGGGGSYTASISDPGIKDTHTVAWDCDGDGFDDGIGLTASCTFSDGPDHVLVRAQATDNDGDSGLGSLDVTVENIVPTATFNAPPDVEEGNDINLSLTMPYDPSNVDSTAGFEYTFDCGEGDGYGTWDSGNTATCPTTDDDLRMAKGKIRDKDGGETEYITSVIVNNVTPVVTVNIENQTVQYSDYIGTVTFTATDVAADDMTATTSALPDSLALTDNGCSTNDGLKTCTWTLAGTMDEPVGDYPVTVTITDDDGSANSAATSVTVIHEDAIIWLDNDNFMAMEVDSPGGDSPMFSLTAHVQETYPDVAANVPDSGDISDAQVEMTLAAVGPGNSYTVMCTPVGVTGIGYDAVLQVSCEFDNVDVNTYDVQAKVVGDYYTGEPDETVLVVFDPSLGFITGGGWFYWPDTMEKTNFGFNVKYTKKGNQTKGSLLIIRHTDSGNYRLKSNAMYGLSVGEAGDPVYGWASFLGKATYKEPGWDEAVGNHEFLMYLEDHNEPGRGFDQFWIEVYDKQGNVVLVMSIHRDAQSNTVTLDGGNIAVPHQGN